MQRGGYSESKQYDRSHRSSRMNDDLMVRTSEVVVNKQLFTQQAQYVKNHKAGKPTETLAGPSTGSHSWRVNTLSAYSGAARSDNRGGTFSSLADTGSRSSHKVHQYSAQNPKMDVQQQLRDEAESVHSTDSVPPHYHGYHLQYAADEGVGRDEMREEGRDVMDESMGLSALASARNLPSSSPKDTTRGLQSDPKFESFQNFQPLPPEFAEIENLQQTLSSMISPSDSLTRDESLSELLLHRQSQDGKLQPRQSTESAKTDSLIGAQAFHGLSPSPERLPLDSGLASHQTSRLTSSQRSGVGPADNSLLAEMRLLRDGLERERCRRKHCEDQISMLQARILEVQQLLAVAQATEKKKDGMIAQLDKTMAKVSASLRQREQEKVTALEKLKTANDSLMLEIEKQKILITDQKRELAELRDQCESLRVTEAAVREQLKQHQKEHKKRWEEAQKLAQLTNKQLESVGEDCLKAERQVKQLQDRLAKEREEWREKELALEQRISSVETEGTASFDEMERKLDEERRTLEDVRRDLEKAKKEADELQRERDKAVREKEKATLELSLQEARWEAKLRTQGAEMEEKHERVMREKMEALQREAEETEGALQEDLRRQAAEMSERHREELRTQKDVHQREVAQREQRRNKAQQQYQSRLTECQQEILKLSTKLEKIQQQKFGMVGKLQTFLQAQCNEAVMMISSIDSSPRPSITNPKLLQSDHEAKMQSKFQPYTPVTLRTNGAILPTSHPKQPGQRDYNHSVTVPDFRQSVHASTAEGDHIKDIHSAAIEEAQEKARLALRQIHLSRGTSETAPHDEVSFHAMESMPATPVPSSEASQGAVHQDTNASFAFMLPTGPSADLRTQAPVIDRAERLPQMQTLMMPANLSAGGMGFLPDFSDGENVNPREWMTRNVDNSFASTALTSQSGFVELKRHSEDTVWKNGIDGEEEQGGSFAEEDGLTGWISQHESTLTSSPTKEKTLSPDLNIHPGQSMMLHIPPTSQAPYHPSSERPGVGFHPSSFDHNISELSSGPLDKLNSPVSSTQEDWKEVALQKYITKLLEMSPAAEGQHASRTGVLKVTQTLGREQQVTKVTRESGVIQKEKVAAGGSLVNRPATNSASTQGKGKGADGVTTGHYQSTGQASRASGPVGAAGKPAIGQLAGTGRGPPSRGKVQKPASQQSTRGGVGAKIQQGPNRPRSLPSSSRDRPVTASGKPQVPRSLQRSTAWR
ncbi:uncharacterized protein [Diadema antillarum]|uniref:uncharacterized protein n=1 Tax=Diadema antillarum TaxID=105358 RepID=UPI003A8B7F25